MSAPEVHVEVQKKLWIFVCQKYFSEIDIFLSFTALDGIEHLFLDAISTQASVFSQMNIRVHFRKRRRISSDFIVGRNFKPMWVLFWK